MKRILLIIAFLFALSNVGFSQSATYQNWCQAGNTTINVQGLGGTPKAQGSWPQCLVTVYLHGTTTPATLTAANCSTPQANPFAANTNGQFLFCASTANLYDVVMGPNPSVPATSTMPVTTLTGVNSSGGGGGGGGVSANGTLTLGQPTYGNGAAIIQTQPTELSADTFTGADICAKITAAIAALPSTGGRVLVSAQNYATCSGPLAISHNNIILKGAGMGNFSTGICATTINFPAASSGITLTGQSSSVEEMCIKSTASVLGTGDGLTFGGGSPKCNRIVVKGFSRDGIVLNDGTDLWDYTSCYADSNKRNGFYHTPGCSDENAGTARNPSATSNGGVGFDIECGVSNTWIEPHANSNTGGNYVVNTSYNTFINLYSETGPTSTLVLGGTNQGFNHFWIPGYGLPTTITDNQVADTNSFVYDVFSGVEGQFPAQNQLSLASPPSGSPTAFYSWVVDGATFGSQELLQRDRRNQTNLYYYLPASGHHFLKPVSIGTDNSIAGLLTLSNGSVFAHTTIGTQATSNWTFNFPVNAGTVGQCLTTDGSGNGIWATCGTGGGGTIAPTLLLLKGDNAGNAIAAASADVVGLFSGCSGAKYLGADGACHLATGITNSAGANVITKSDGTNVVASSMSDNGTVVTTLEQINAGSICTGTCPTALPAGANGVASSESATTGTPTAGVDYIRADILTHKWVKSENGGTEVPMTNPGTVTSVTPATGAGTIANLGNFGFSNGTTIPALTITLTNVVAHNFFGNNTGSTAPPNYFRPACADLSDASTFCNGTAASLLTAGLMSGSITTPTQTFGTNNLTLASTAFVQAAVATGVGTGFNGGAGTTYQDAAAISAPANPGSGCRLYIDSGTGLLTGKNSIGGNCAPSGGGGGLADPGANGVMTRTSLNVTAQAAADAMAAPISASAVGGSSNAITITLSPCIAAQTQAYMRVTFTPSANTTSTTPTAAVCGLTALTIKKKSSAGLVALVSGDIVSAQGATLELDPTVTFWVLTNPQTTVTPSGKCDPTDPTQYCFVEEFGCGNTTAGSIGCNGWNLGTVGSAGTASQIISTWPHLGVHALNTNAAATQGQGETLFLGGQAMLGDINGNTNWSSTWIFQLQETTTSVFRAGAMTANNVLRPVTFVGIRYDINSPLTAQAITSISCNSGTALCTVTNAGGTMLLPGQKMTIAGASCPTRTVNGTQTMTQLTSGTVWVFAQAGATESCGTPGTVSSVPETNFQFVKQLSNSSAVVVDTGIAADTAWHTLVMTSTVAGQVVFTLDGGSPQTLIGSGASYASSFMEGILGVDSTVAAAKAVYFDRATFYMTGLTR